jgi:hypothetical protein
MFKKNQGGDAVKFGLYWNQAEWNGHVVPPEGGTLPGPESATYVRVPMLMALFVAPLMGAVYAFFLPFIGFAMVGMYLMGRLRGTPQPPIREEAEMRKAA